MKNKWILFTCIMLLASCGSNTTDIISKSRGNILFEDNDYVTLVKGNTQVDGKDKVITIQVKDGYLLEGCSYADYQMSYSDNEYKLTLKQVSYPEKIKLMLKKGCIIYYETNDGGDNFYETVDLSFHKRANTACGENIYKEGYTLIGWNTKKDGSGEHIGVGSRVTIDSNITLYAEYAKETDQSRFSYIKAKDGIYLTSYTGSKTIDDLILPSKINNIDVVGITSGCLSDVNVKKLVVPNSIGIINVNSFANCIIDNMYLYDNLTYICKESFKNTSISSLHINAYSNPRYQMSEISTFADAIDNIMLSSKKDLIFFSGCSFGYGFDGNIASEAFPEYNIVNCGVIGEASSTIQWDIITSFLKDGDVVVHAPEEGCYQQLMYTNRCDSRIFVITEGNYDLLSYANISIVAEFFDSFGHYLSNRNKIEKGSYSDYPKTVNQYGDIISIRPSNDTKEALTTNYNYEPDCIDDQSMALLISYYERAMSKGATVYFSFAPVSRYCLSIQDEIDDLPLVFQNKIYSYLKNTDIKIISNANDYCFDGKYFYDTDYHLSNEGAIIRTNQLIEDLSKVFKEESK